MDIEQQVKKLLDDVMGLGGRAESFDRSTHLLGSVPELDSMAVVSIITALEERLGIVVDDEDIHGSTFETLGSLVDFVAARI